MDPITQKPTPATQLLITSLLFEMQSRTGNLIILTGDHGSGKTAWCQALYRAALECGLMPCGLISPARFTGGEKTGIELIDLSSGERRELAEKRDIDQVGAADQLETNAWRFDATTLAWGEARLNELLVPDRVRDDVLVIDEMGPLEFERNQGWLSGLRLVDRRNYRLACVTIRPALLESACLRWSWGRVVQVSAGGK